MSIYEQVLAFIARPEIGDFEPLALAVFRHQFETVRAYREYCLGLGVHAEDVESIGGVPPVSALAFKYARLGGAADLAGARTFLTSGTTAGRAERGCHVVPRPELYRASALAHLGRMLFPDGRRMRSLALHPTADRMPESSLSQMITWCIEEFAGAQPSACAADRAGLDPEAAFGFLRDAEREHAAVCILGTTASFGALFGHLEHSALALRLAAGSRLMDTGGAKGQRVPLDPQAVCERAQRLLGIDRALVINEYGMTELCSQLYDATRFNSDDDSAPAERVKIAPPWLRASAVDPVSLRPVAPGGIGMLRFFDLANAGSVSAILTEDFGSVDGDRVRVVGRAGAAEPRGCALAIEQFEAEERGRSSVGGAAIR